eukprot:179628_1
MANILNMKSIAEYGHVRKEVRHQTIETYQKAISSFPHTNVKCLNIIPKVATYHCNIAIEYGRMRLWQKSHEELFCNIDYIMRGGHLLSSERKLNSCLAESFGLVGWLWLQQYHESVFLGLSDTRSKQILKKSEYYTLKALELLKLLGNYHTSKDTCKTISFHFLYHTHTQQCYFLGEIDDAFANLHNFLERYTSESDFCHGCGQNHGESEADMVVNTCAGCKSVFYCNKLCQTRHWIGEGFPLCFINHKHLCPLLRFWRKARKQKLD